LVGKSRTLRGGRNRRKNKKLGGQATIKSPEKPWLNDYRARVFEAPNLAIGGTNEITLARAESGNYFEK
jgi:hypothetical protein